MKILVAGGFDPEDARADKIRLLCRAVGRAIAVHGHTLYSGARSELDALVAEAASEALEDDSEGSRQEFRDQRIVSYCLAGEDPIHHHGDLRISRLENWELGTWPYHVPEPVRDADVVVLIAGSTGTNRTANWAKIAGKPLLPFPAYGGAAAKVYAYELDGFEHGHYGRLDRSDFEQLNSIKDAAAHAAYIVALAEKIVQSWSVVAIMSYDDRPDLQNAYETFKRVCKDLGFACESISEKNTTTRIIPEIFGRIHRAAFIIADITGLKPNVLYELGFAGGAGATIIVTAKKGTRLPFDLNDIPIIYWESQEKLEEDLRDKIQSVMKLAILHATPPIGQF